MGPVAHHYPSPRPRPFPEGAVPLAEFLAAAGCPVPEVQALVEQGLPAAAKLRSRSWRCDHHR